MSFSINTKSINYINTSRGVAFSADLYSDGEKIGLVENRGDGGDTVAAMTTDIPSLNQLSLIKLDDEARLVVPDSCEPTSTYLELLMDAAEGLPGAIKLIADKLKAAA